MFWSFPKIFIREIKIHSHLSKESWKSHVTIVKFFIFFIIYTECWLEEKLLC